MPTKPLLLAGVVLLIACGSVMAAGNTEETEEPSFVLEVVGHGEEYLETERAIWDMYEELNPNVTVEVYTVNEDQRPAFEARLAAGDAPSLAILQYPVPNTENYELYVDLRTIGYDHWDSISSFDARTIWEDTMDIPFTPGLVWQGGRYLSFIYHADEMNGAGLDPAATVRSWDDLDVFLSQLKTYVDGTSEFDYVLDFGWHSWTIGQQLIPMLANGLGGSLDEQYDVYLGRTAWTSPDNPFRPAFEKLKEWTDKGYFPDRWWTRDWGQDYEAGFIGKKSILALHGPWLWDKTEAADASANLDGFPIPTVNGVIVGIEVKTSGAGIYAANVEDPNFDEIVRAFNWTMSPEITKIRAEGMNSLSAMDLADVGGLELTGTQFEKIIERIDNGYFGDVVMDFRAHPQLIAARYRTPGNPQVLNDDGFVTYLADYLTGTIDLDELMEICQDRWEHAYSLP